MLNYDKIMRYKQAKTINNVRNMRKSINKCNKKVDKILCKMN